MTEKEFLCKSFIEASLEKEHDGDVYLTLVSKANKETDIFPQVNKPLSQIFFEILDDKEKIKELSEIKVKSTLKNKICVLNTIEIN